MELTPLFFEAAVEAAVLLEAIESPFFFFFSEAAESADVCFEPEEIILELELEAGVVDAGLVLFTSDVEAESTVLFELDVESAGFFLS